MKRLLFDSNLYIESLRRSDGSLLLARNYGGALLHLSSVVLEELYAGCSDAKAEAAIDKLHSSFARAGRLVTPNDSDWAEVGRVLQRIGRKYGYEQIGRARLTNDALIAISSGRVGVAVATINTDDFLLIRQFRHFHLLGVSLGSQP